MSAITANQPDNQGKAAVAPESQTRTLVVGYDGSESAKVALTVAIEIASWAQASKIVIACGQGQPSFWSAFTYANWTPAVLPEGLIDELEAKIADDLEEAAERVRAAGIEATTACIREHPVDTVLRVARETHAALIVVGAKGAGALHDVVMGSTTMHLLHHSEIPVLVVPARS
ncbi:MAG: universal stress protein [Thermoleophilia bacterium]